MFVFPKRSGIPAQLCQTEFRFIKVEKQGKRPIETDWVRSHNYQYNDPELLKWIENGGNYGVLGGYGNLVILDFDSLAAATTVNPSLPKTFTCKSGGRGMPHVYYILDQRIQKYPIKGEDQKTLVDVQAMGAQVVGPNSKLSEGRSYGVIDHSDIAHIDLSQLQSNLRPLTPQPVQIPQPKVRMDYKPSNSVFDEVMRYVNMPRLLNRYGIDTKRLPTACPFNHPSDHNKCFSLPSAEVGHCFNCNWSGNVISLVKAKEHLSAIDAVKWLAKEFSVPIDFQEKKVPVMASNEVISDESEFLSVVICE